MQSADPRNTWWRELTNQTRQANIFDRGSYQSVDARELVPRAAFEGYVPEGGRQMDWYWLAHGDPHWTEEAGHRNPFFIPAQSYFWGVPYLMQQIQGNSRNARCCVSNTQDLIDAAVDYNGGGDPQYRKKIRDAIDMIGCMPKLLEPDDGLDDGLVELRR
ncbi:MAG: hypothetical protein ACYTKD_19010 [Planctomycetota bacterium]|jgi:hypothetical protein